MHADRAAQARRGSGHGADRAHPAAARGPRGVQERSRRLLRDGAAVHRAADRGRRGAPGRLDGRRDVLLRFTRALYRAQRWMTGVDAKPIAEVVAPAFPDIDQAIRLRAVRRYLGQDTWARDPILERPGYEYLQQILLDGGFITRRHRYEDLIDTAIARDVIGDAARRQ